MDLDELREKYDNDKHDPDDRKEIDVDLDTVFAEHGVFEIDECKEDIRMVLKNHFGNHVIDWVDQ